MTLQEAIKSGKRFRPSNWDDEFFDYKHWSGWFEYFDSMGRIVPRDFILEEFEVEQKTVEISEEKLREALEKCADNREVFADALIKELGLRGDE